MANISTIPAIVGPGDQIVSGAFTFWQNFLDSSDQLSHLSLIDGIRLSGAKLSVFPTNNLEKLEEILKSLPNKGNYTILPLLIQ